jgi:hypothetical protein
MTLPISWSGALIGIALLAASSGMVWSQSNVAPNIGPPDDPATSGAGPTSGAPGQYNYDPPKGGSVTTNSRGVTTTQPTKPAPQSSEAPRDIGNESGGATAPK